MTRQIMVLDGDDPTIAVPARPLWRNRDFVLLWSGQTVSTLGTSVSLLALPLLALALTRSPAQAGFLAAVQSLPYLVFSLPAGALIDRWDRKRVMIRCDAARFIVYGSVPLAYALGHLTIAQLYLVALVGGTAFVFFNIAEVASLPRVVPEARLAQANAINAAAESSAQLVGPGLSGFIISLARTTASGASVAYLADSVSYLASVVSLFFIATPFQHERPAAQIHSLRAEIAEGIRFLWRRRPLRIVSLLTLCLNICFSPAYLAVIVLARGPLHADARTIGVIFSLGSIGGVVGSLIAPLLKTRLRFGQIIVGSAALQALALPVLAAAVSPLMLVIGEAVLTMMVPIYNVAVISYRLALTPDALQGRVNSVARLLAFASIPLGTAVGGVLLASIGPRVELWAGTIGMGLTVLMVGLSEVRRA